MKVSQNVVFCDVIVDVRCVARLKNLRIGYLRRWRKHSGWRLDEDSVFVLHDAPGHWIVDAVGLTVVATSYQSSFHRLEFELLGMPLDVDEGSGIDDSKKPNIRIRSV